MCRIGEILGQKVARPTWLYFEVDNPKVMSWMKDKKFCEKDREKLEKGGGFDKLITMVCNWLYRVLSW